VTTSSPTRGVAGGDRPADRLEPPHEWEQLSHPAEDPESARDLVEAHARPAGPRPISANERSFMVLVRNAMFRRVELAARRAYDDLGELDAELGMDADAWREAVEAYLKEHDSIGTGPDARGPHMIVVEREGRTWRVQQILGRPRGRPRQADRRRGRPDASDEAAELVLSEVDLVEL